MPLRQNLETTLAVNFGKILLWLLFVQLVVNNGLLIIPTSGHVGRRALCVKTNNAFLPDAALRRVALSSQRHPRRQLDPDADAHDAAKRRIKGSWQRTLLTIGNTPMVHYSSYSQLYGSLVFTMILQ